MKAGAVIANAQEANARNQRATYQAEYRKYVAQGYTQQEAAAKAKAVAYPTPEWARK